MDATVYPLLSRLFEHPGPSFHDAVGQATAALEEPNPEAAAALRRFAALLPRGDLLALEELHTRTFDVQAITTLDVGYVLFGEDYKRGALLANLAREHQAAGNDCGAELGDHLGNVLRLLPKLKDEALRAELVEVLLGPAVHEMIREFAPDRVARKEALYKKHHKTLIEHAAADTRCAWRHALEAVHAVLRADFGLEVAPAPGKESGFARSIGTELSVEAEDQACSTTRPGELR